MSIEDRDWYRESYKEKEKKYGGDFSLHSKKKSEEPTSSGTDNKGSFHLDDTWAVVISFFGAVAALMIFSKLNMVWPIPVMLIYDLWMIIHIFSEKPKAKSGIKILAVIFFIISAGLMCLLLYLFWWSMNH